ncbi:DUF4424 family protein [Azospirillum halopraeferens]|uniref:DUF4424 family protein n=1 Tax=Azospirillum halopraeferens TaxID=34010 RepID=UPI00040F7A8A|nr:DUF4424 family protein [Azospirillum halopraeferens]
MIPSVVHRRSLFAAAAVAVLALSGPAMANDSSGFQGTSGIELTTSDSIRMVSEDLRIGLDEIRISYVFRNVGERPVDTMVVFPLPDLDLSQGLTAPNWAFPVDADDFLNFRLWIDDRPVAPRLERRAFFRGEEVTRDLEAAGALGLVPWRPGGYDEQARDLPAGALAALRQKGLIAEGEDENTPQWTLRSRYHWQQTFPPGVDVTVRHIYKPFVGLAIIGKATDIDGRTVVGRYIGDVAEAGDRYCLDERTRKALAAVERRSPADSMPFYAAEIEYILTTARNWHGPIGRFHLTLDKGAPENILSLCWDGLTKTGPTTFESTKTDFVPDDEIRMLVFVRSREQP